MDAPIPFLVQLLFSAIAVAAMVGLAAWIGIPRVIGGMTEDRVRSLLAEEHPALPVDHVSIAPDGKSAIAHSGEQALLVKRVGDGHVVQIVPLSQINIRRRDVPTPDTSVANRDVAA